MQPRIAKLHIDMFAELLLQRSSTRDGVAIARSS